MSPRNNNKGISVPSINEVTAQENNEVEQTQEVTATNEVNQGAQESQNEANQENAQANEENANQGAQGAPTQELVTLADVLAFTPEAIDSAIAELESHHATVNVLVGKMPEAAIEATRQALGISADIEADKEAVRARLGGKVASLVPQLKQELQWENVAEYAQLLTLMDTVNDARTKLGLPLLSFKQGGKSQGAAKTTNASIHPKRNAGYMQPGTIEGSVGKHKVQWIVSDKHILVRVDGLKCYEGAQGAISLSMIHNDFVRPTAELSGRESFPGWLSDNGFDPDVVMLNVAPTVSAPKN